MTAKPFDETQPVSTPRSQHGENYPIGPGPSGAFQTDDQDNLHNNVSNLGDGQVGKSVEQDRVRERAYALWEADGRPQHGDQYYWYRAEQELAGEAQH